MNVLEYFFETPFFIEENQFKTLFSIFHKLKFVKIRLEVSKLECFFLCKFQGFFLFFYEIFINYVKSDRRIDEYAISANKICLFFAV